MSQPASFASTCNWSHDVFISFRGEDTRYGFVGNLYYALTRKGIRTFIDDDEVRKHEEITPTLLKAIENSRMAIIVFSKNFVSSIFCLNELVQILHCILGKGRLVWPIFYDMQPSDVHDQKGNYEEALTVHKNNFKEEEIQSWKFALHKAADLSGLRWNPRQEYEYQIIENIVKEISSKICRVPLRIADYPVGLESRLLEINPLLEVGSNTEVFLLGIYGIGGMGKSTIARAVYNSIADHFESLCFLHDIKESSSKVGLEHLQERMLSNILAEDIKVDDIHGGLPIIKRRLAQKKVLLVLDDVDKIEQLEKLVGVGNWFGIGSRIIITTRDKQLLIRHGIKRIYNMKELNDEESLDLLRWNAVKSDQVDPTCREVLSCAAKYAEGLPLALEVIGSNFFGKSIIEWKSTLDMYEKIPINDIQHKLKVSYDCLDELEKEIFLDIACFFNSEKLEFVKVILKHIHGLDPNFGIGALMDRCLVKIENNCIRMHDFIQIMGREIVLQESSSEPGQRSRLWSNEDIVHVLENNTGTKRTCVIIQESWCDDKKIKVDWDGKALESMKNLKVLSLKNACFSKGPIYLPNSLKVLRWRDYPGSYLPVNFNMTKLVVLDLQASSSPWLEPINKWENLSVLDFSHSQLTVIPEVSGIPNLIELRCHNCENLIEVPDSVGYLEKLKILDVERCKNLRTFPGAIKLPSLEYLGLNGCSSLEKFPEVLEKMEYLEELDLGFTRLKLPNSIHNITRLCRLDMRECRRVTLLPSSIDVLSELEVKSDEGCGQGQGVVLCSNVVAVRLAKCNISNEVLQICLNWFSNLKWLSLSESNVTILPECIKECHFLELLYLEHCEHLKEIRVIPPNIKEIWASGCISLSSESRSILLSQDLHEAGQRQFVVPGTTLPDWFHHRTRGPSISFWFRNKPPVFSLCFVGRKLEIYDSRMLSFFDVGFPLLFANVMINGKMTSERYFRLRKNLRLSDHIFMSWDVKLSDEMGKLFHSEWNHVEICMDKLKDVKEMGLHVKKQEISMEDIRFTNPLEVTCQNYRLDSNDKSLTWDPMECEYQVTCDKDPVDQKDPWLKLLCSNLFNFVVSLCSS